MAKVHNNVCLRFFLNFKKFNQILLCSFRWKNQILLKRRAHRRPLFTTWLCLILLKKKQNLLFFATKEPKLYGEGVLRHPLSTPGSRLHLFLANIRLVRQRKRTLWRCRFSALVLAKSSTHNGTEISCAWFSLSLWRTSFCLLRNKCDAEQNLPQQSASIQIKQSTEVFCCGELNPALF